MHFAAWKRVLVVIVLFVGAFYALPNLFYNTVEAQNDAEARIEKGLTEGNEELYLGQWPGFLSDRLVNLGLDLRGGVHLVVAVALDQVHEERYDLFWTEARNTLRDAGQFGNVRRVENPDGGFWIEVEHEGDIANAQSLVSALAQPVGSLTGAVSRDFNVDIDGERLRVEMSDAELTAVDDQTMARSLEIIRRRIDAAGTREPSIQRQGDDRILVEVPGFGSAEDVLSLIGRTAKLTFHPVEGFADTLDDRHAPDEVIYPGVEGDPSIYILDSNAVVGGDMLTDAQMQFDQNNAPAVGFRFNPTGARKFGDYTAENIGQPFAIVLDGEVISAPTIQSYIGGGSGIITGNFSVEEAQDLAVLLRSGALPAEIAVLEQNVIGPDLGQDSINAGSFATMIALLAVLVYMVVIYRRFGLYANAALLANIVLIIGSLSIIGATLTLPGIAGIVLTIGMAVDANVLIFERIREENKSGASILRALETGFDKASGTIIDANVTTFIAAATLYSLGAGPVRGFAVTLMIGILSSMFTALLLTNWLVTGWANRKRRTQLPIA